MITASLRQLLPPLRTTLIDVFNYLWFATFGRDEHRRAVGVDKRIRCPKDDDEAFPGCGSTNVVGPDREGLYDCQDCGLWFRPKRKVMEVTNRA